MTTEIEKLRAVFDATKAYFHRLARAWGESGEENKSFPSDELDVLADKVHVALEAVEPGCISRVVEEVRENHPSVAERSRKILKDIRPAIGAVYSDNITSGRHVVLIERQTVDGRWLVRAFWVGPKGDVAEVAKRSRIADDTLVKFYTRAPELDTIAPKETR